MQKTNKLICPGCGARFDEYNWDHTKRYTMCFDCWNEQLPNTVEPYASQKDYDESNGFLDKDEGAGVDAGIE
jgi:hypothetical protein